MQLKNAAVFLLSILLIISMLVPTVHAASKKKDQSQLAVYLKINIHGTERFSGSKRSLRASYANYIGDYNNHTFIPVNTPVVITKVKKNGIYMTSTVDGAKITFEFNAKNMAPVTSEEYVGYITAPRKTSLKSLSPIDQKGIKDGKAYVGMSKNAVRIALGHPALHRTPSLKENVWTYWKNRFATGAVEFDAGGRVKSVR
jgi:hypothetical protein